MRSFSSSSVDYSLYFVFFLILIGVGFHRIKAAQKPSILKPFVQTKASLSIDRQLPYGDFFGSSSLPCSLRCSVTGSSSSSSLLLSD